MEDKLYKIILADGTVLDDLRLNGNNFISTKKLTEEDFKYNLGHATIESSDGIKEYDNMELVQIQQYGSEYWFVLRQLSAQELMNMKTQANIEYIAMMSDIDLD